MHPNVLPVVDEAPGWVRVLLATRGALPREDRAQVNGRTGWVRTTDLMPSGTDWSVVVDVDRAVALSGGRRLVLFHRRLGRRGRGARRRLRRSLQDEGVSEVRGARELGVTEEFPVEVDVAVRRDDLAGRGSEGLGAVDRGERGHVERRHAAGPRHPDTLNSAFFSIEHDLQVGHELGRVQRVRAGQLVERRQELIGEDRVQTVVNGVQVARERRARGVERGLVAGLDARHVVLDGAAPALDAAALPAAAVRAAAALTVLGALLVELVLTDRRRGHPRR